MIGLDITLPEDCEQCPCSYWITHGEHEGQLMCEAMETINPWDGLPCYLVSDLERPQKCPMKEIIRCKECKHGKRYETGYNTYIYGCDRTNGLHEPDWFCANGEKTE